MSDNKTTTTKDPSHLGPDCPNKNCWLELEIRDEENKPVSGLNGVLTDAKGKEYKVSGPLQLIKPIAPGAATLVFKRKELVDKSLTLPMREEAQPNPVQEYADSTMGHEETKKTYQLLDVSTQAASEQNDQKSDAKSEAIELATRQSYVLELPGMGIEYIAVVGAQYDSGLGNKMSFPAQGVRYLRKVNAKENKDVTTLLICNCTDKHKYTEKQLALIKKSAEKFKFKYLEISSAAEIVSYLNSGDKKHKRDKYKVRHLYFFGHGYPPSSMGLGYNTESQEKLAFSFESAGQLKTDAFALDAQIFFYG